jgi:Flp pilus assembly protein TadG
VKDTVAEVADDRATVMPIRAGPLVCATVKVNACAGAFGSVPVTVKLPRAVEKTVTGAIGATVGARTAFTTMVVLAEAVPHCPVTVNVAVTGEVAPMAENVVVEAFAGATLPLDTAHAKVNGPVPPAMPERATVPPAATVYGPPALAVAGVHAGAGILSPGHGFSWPGITPELEG